MSANSILSQNMCATIAVPAMVGAGYYEQPKPSPPRHSAWRTNVSNAALCAVILAVLSFDGIESTALAGCVAGTPVSGTQPWLCSGVTTPPYSITAVHPAVTANSTFVQNVTAVTGNFSAALNIKATDGLSFTQNAGSTITATPSGYNGITISNGVATPANETAINVNLAGTVTGGSMGVSLSSTGKAAITLTSTGTVTGTTGQGIVVSAGNPNAGAISVTAGNVTGKLYGLNLASVGTGNITVNGISGTTIKGDNYGIAVYNSNAAATSNISVTTANASADPASLLQSAGVYVRNNSLGSTTVDSTNGTVSGVAGIWVLNKSAVSTGLISVTSGTATGKQNGISISSDGIGNITTITKGIITGTNGHGISIADNSANIVTPRTIAVTTEKTVTGYTAGINVVSNGGSTITINSSASTVSSGAGHGYNILANSKTSTANINLTTADVTGQQHGISVRSASMGTINVNSTGGTINAFTGAGIIIQPITDNTVPIVFPIVGTITVTAAKISAKASGININSYGNNSTNISLNNAVTASAGNGIILSGSRAFTTINVLSTASVTGSASGINLGGAEGNNEIINNGAISGSTAAISAGDGTETLRQQAGSISGNVALGNGNNIFNLSGGAVTGNLSSGTGNDTLAFAGATVTGNSNLGDGANSVTMTGGLVTGSITSGTGADSFAFSSGTLKGNIATGAGNDTLTFAGSTMTGNLALGAGNDTTTLSSGSLAGIVDLGDDDDALALENGFDYSAVPMLDGGAGSDHLTLSGLNIRGYSSASTDTTKGINLRNMEQIDLVNSTSLKLQGDLFAANDTGHLMINQGTVLDLKGNSPGLYTIYGTVTNAGLATFEDGAADDHTTIVGDYNGNEGTLAFDTYLGDDNSPSDTLTITGNATGHTAVTVAPTGGQGAATVNGIALITVTGSAMADSFTLDRPLEAGAYAYRMEYKAGKFVLVSTRIPTPTPTPTLPQFNSIAAMYESASSAALDTLMTSMSTLEQRTGQRQWAAVSQKTGEGRTHEGFWLRAIGDYAKATPTSSDADVRYKIWSAGAQAGFDRQVYSSASGQLVAGLNGKFITGKADTKNIIGHGQVHNHMLGGGLSTTWYGNNGLYFDSQNELFWVRQKFATDSAGTLKKGADRMAFSTSAELGYRYHINAVSALVPQAQYSLAHLDRKHFTDKLDNDLHYKSASENVLRAGLAYEYLDQQQGTEFGSFKKVYVIGNILYNFGKSRKVDMLDVRLKQRNNRLWAEAGLGGSIGWDQGKMLYLEGSYRDKISGGHGANHGLKGNVGFKYSW